MYEAITSGIRVIVRTSYLPERSEPDEDRHFWAYSIEIRNEGKLGVQIVSRSWTIVDGLGRVETVEGPGVVGVQPSIAPGGRFEYTSGCPLTTTSGIMVGTYQARLDDGSTLEVAIPAFSLDLPDARPVLN